MPRKVRAVVEAAAGEEPAQVSVQGVAAPVECLAGVAQALAALAPAVAEAAAQVLRVNLGVCGNAAGVVQVRAAAV